MMQGGACLLQRLLSKTKKERKKERRKTGGEISKGRKGAAVGVRQKRHYFVCM